MSYILIILLIILSTSLLYILYKNIHLNTQIQFLHDKISQDNKNYIDLNQKLIALEDIKIQHIQKVEQLSQKLQYQEQLIANFEQLRDESTKSNKSALFDLGNELSKQLIDIHKKETKENRDLSEKNIKDTSIKFNSEFERVVSMVGALSKEISQSKDTVDIIKNSLLSPSGAGSLAEITLENILKSSGLRANIDFIMQYNVTLEDKTMLRPDAVIFLSDNKLMVVDAKASKFLVDDRGDLKNLAKTMNTHLRSLSSKSYAELVKKNLNNQKIKLGNLVTLMFLPSEHAVEKIIEADLDFMNKAWKENIFPVGPAGLMNMLSFAKFQISERLTMHNHQEIIEEVKKLIASVGTMVQHSTKLGNSISSAANHYDKFAASFNHNFLSKARHINKMGVETSLAKNQKSLQRLQVISAKSDLIEIETEDESVNKTILKSD